MGIEFYLPSLKTVVRGGSYASSLIANEGFIVPTPFKAVNALIERKTIIIGQ